MKIRFWFQEFVPVNAPKVAPLAPAGFSASHHNLPRLYQQTEANAGEYDIPPAFRLSEDEQIVGYMDYPVRSLGQRFHDRPRFKRTISQHTRVSRVSSGHDARVPASAEQLAGRVLAVVMCRVVFPSSAFARTKCT